MNFVDRKPPLRKPLPHGADDPPEGDGWRPVKAGFPLTAS